MRSLLARRLIPAFLLAWALVSPTRAGLSMTHSFAIDPESRPASLRVEIPADQVVAGARLIALECVSDGARAPLSATARVGYQGFERGRHVAWLELPEERWLPAEHDAHPTRLTVQLELEPSTERPVPRERVVPEWWEGGRPTYAMIGSSRAIQGPDGSAAGSGPMSHRRSEPFKPTQVPSLLGSPVAYLIVTTDALVEAFQPLADWKTASGVPAVIRTLSFIREQYPAAADDPERLRLFIRDA